MWYVCSEIFFYAAFLVRFMEGVGVEAGPCGRVFRLYLGLGILFFVAYRFLQSFISFGFAAVPPLLTVLGYFTVIVSAYLALYWVLLRTEVGRRNAWFNTVMIVGPPYALFILHFTLYRMDLVLFALLLYIGISLLFSYRIGYGGCEMITLPIMLFKKRCTTYCIPVVVVDLLDYRRRKGKMG